MNSAFYALREDRLENIHEEIGYGMLKLGDISKQYVWKINVQNWVQSE